MVVGLRQAKLQFFDRQVFTAKERAQKRVMSRFGAYVRKDAKESMGDKRRGKKKIITRGPRKGQETREFEPSDPGKPPRVIEGQLKRFLFFLYEPQKDTVIIGPIKLGRSSKPVPGLHEHGGTQVVRFGKRTRVATYPPRPFMQPAGEKNLQKLGDLWRDAIR